MRHWLGLTRENRKEEARKGENDIYIYREREIFPFLLLSRQEQELGGKQG
jgi:hypothetical protein